jgi:hypothetical protein
MSAWPANPNRFASRTQSNRFAFAAPKSVATSSNT